MLSRQLSTRVPSVLMLERHLYGPRQFVLKIPPQISLQHTTMAV